jgi:transposase, IS30 family
MSRVGYPKSTRQVFWRAVAAGASTEQAAGAAGVSVDTGKAWFANAGGMSPVELAEPSGRYLSEDERETIGLEHAAGLGTRAIARLIGRSPSTVSRELRRNISVRRPRRYRPRLAQHKAEARARRPKPSKIAANPRLREQVQQRLTAKLSPEQISAELREAFPDDADMQVSHESIYRSLFVQGRGELRRELAKNLRTGRALRKPRGRVDGRRGGPKDMLMISERPAEVADRAVPGHWEGDLIIGAHSRSAIGTLVERSTRFVILLHLPDTHGAEAVRDAIVEAMRELPEHLRRSLTWDQGSEMARHAEITLDADLPVYFCDPASPWQRGSNENTNGLLRQYFAKGTDLSVFPKDYLDYVAAQLNRRPRKTLGWKRPAVALNDLLSAPPDRSVATTG